MTNNTQKENAITEEALLLARYRRAETLEHEVCDQSMVLNAEVFPHWIDGSNCFWYIKTVRDEANGTAGKAREYRLVNAEAASNTLAFDHQLMASLLAQASGQEVNPNDLPISELTLELSPLRVTFTAFGQCWQFDAAAERCEEITVHDDPNAGAGLLSPDGKKVAFTRDYNLWVRDVKSGEESAMTFDGERYYAYAVQPESRNLTEGLPGTVSWFPVSLEAFWSPDSSKLFTLQTDERQVRSVPSMLYVPQDGSVAPQVVERKSALPGDKHIAQYRMLVIDVETAQEIAADYPPIEDSFISYCPFNGNVGFKGNLAWWSGDGRQAFFVDMTRGQKTARVVAFDAQTGASNVLFEETSDTFLDLIPYQGQPSMLTPLPDTDELIWFSERTGWAHLYLYDMQTGEMKNTITSGDWRVRDIVYFDKTSRALFLQVAGRVAERNPYYRELVRVNIDSSEMTVIASGNYDYCTFRPPMQNSGISLNGEYIVTTRSRVDDPPVTELRDRNGELILIVEAADIAGLPVNWQWPEPVAMKAADNETDIYGVVFRPSDFDSEKRYPVLDLGMASPFCLTTPRGSFSKLGMDPIQNIFYMSFAALAELGFIVTVMEGRGTLNRSKAFHNFGYESFMQGCDIVDHVAGIKQLAERYPYMDLDNVGIMTPDAAGNGPVHGLLNHPDFYKVGVAFSTWDPRLVKQGEIYYGLVNEPDHQQPLWQDAAKNLQGKLLLIAGLLDQLFHSSMTFQLVDALAKANKDFDLFIHPNGGHGAEVEGAHRRTWDYLVRHLQGLEPPKDFVLTTGMQKMGIDGMPEKGE